VLVLQQLLPLLLHYCAGASAGTSAGASTAAGRGGEKVVTVTVQAEQPPGYAKNPAMQLFAYSLLVTEASGAAVTIPDTRCVC
jgi:hypothetical protein